MTQSGWSSEWPQVNDTFYWMRWCDGRYRDLPVHVAGTHVMCLFDHSYLQRGNIEGQVEFLGPIHPADAERLIRLRNMVRYHARRDHAEFHLGKFEDCEMSEMCIAARAALE